MNKHTPTPWAYRRFDGEKHKIHIGIDGNLDTVHDAHAIVYAQEDCGDDEANASHIVHCVNTHDALVEALERINEMTDNTEGPSWELQITVIYDIVASALAAAKQYRTTERSEYCINCTQFNEMCRLEGFCTHQTQEEHIARKMRGY